MELTDQRIETLKLLVCEYYKVSPSILDDPSNKMPKPFIRQMISYFANTMLNVTQQSLANYWGKKTHASICTSISNIRNNMDVNKRLKFEVQDLNRIINERGISDKAPKNNEWYRFVDLNNFVLATSGTKAILMVNLSPEEIEDMKLQDWKIEDQNNTGKFYYTRLKQANNKNK